MTRPDLDAQVLVRSLTDRAPRDALAVLGEVDSTMDEAARRARAGAPDGTVVIADHQTAGRGRLGRQWLAPPGTALLLTVLLRPTLAPDRLHELPMAMALGALQAVRSALPAGAPTAALKWPNDLLVGGEKLGGILAESQMTAGGSDWLAIGLGLNVHQTARQLPPEATSLRLLGTPFRRDALAAMVLEAFGDLHDQVRSGRSLLALWTANLATIGSRVRAACADGPIEGVAVDVHADGALVVLDDCGARHVLRAGDVTLRPGRP